MLIQREIYMNKIRGFVDQPEIVKVITGLRRCGKSIMLELIQQELLARGVKKEQILAYNFEDMGLNELKTPEKLYAHLKEKTGAKKGRFYIFLDEIQEVENWETPVNSLRVNSDADIYITGSNAKMLMGEYATRLAGRYVEIRMSPFSFGEYCVAAREKTPEASNSELFRLYLTHGGMPFLTRAGLGEADSMQYLRDLYASVMIKDIIKQNSFRDVDLLERIIAYVMANVGKTFSATSISNFFKSEKRIVAPETILNYLKGCEDAYLFNRIRRLDVPGKRMLQVNEKYYIADHGFREAVYGNNERDMELVLENIVCQELLRRGYTVSVGRVGDKEIDFVCDRQNERIYVQVCYLLSGEGTVQREFGVFREISDNYPKYVVSLDEFDMSREGILHQNIREFLLSA